MPIKKGARATELESSDALVQRPLEIVLPLLGTGLRQGAHCDVPISDLLERITRFSTLNI